MRATLVYFFVQKMIGSKLQDGVEKLVEMLARLPY